MFRGIAAYARRHHLALLALFVALGGTSFAAGNALLPRNSVGSAQLQKGAVTKAKIAKKTLVALKGNRGLRGAQGLRGLQGPQGAQGAQGAQGLQGSQGPEGPGATSFSTTEPQDGVNRVVTTVAGLAVRVDCDTSLVFFQLLTSSLTATEDLSGTFANSTPGTLSQIDFTGSMGLFGSTSGATATADIDVIARNTAVSTAFSRFDLHVTNGSPCTVWGMITPSKLG